MSDDPSVFWEFSVIFHNSAINDFFLSLVIEANCSNSLQFLRQRCVLPGISFSAKEGTINLHSWFLIEHWSFFLETSLNSRVAYHLPVYKPVHITLLLFIIKGRPAKLVSKQCHCSTGALLFKNNTRSLFCIQRTLSSAYTLHTFSTNSNNLDNSPQTLNPLLTSDGLTTLVIYTHTQSQIDPDALRYGRIDPSFASRWAMREYIPSLRGGGWGEISKHGSRDLLNFAGTDWIGQKGSRECCAFPWVTLGI